MGYFETMDLYSPGSAAAEPRTDRERVDWILRKLGSRPATEGSPATDAADYGGFAYRPPESESQRGAGVYRREYVEPLLLQGETMVRSPLPPPIDYDSNSAPDAIRSLGDEMVLLLSGGGIGGALARRALPYAVQAGRQGLATISGLTAEAEQAASTITRSFMNRLGRPPSIRELFEALGHTKFIPGDQEQGSGDTTSQISSLGNAQEPILHPEPERWPVSSALQALGEIQDRLRALGGKTFQSYTKKGLETEGYYAGMTSGTKPPVKNVANRDADMYPSPNYHPAELDRSSSRYSSIRGREQYLIDNFRRRSISDNKYNSVGPRNKFRNYYLRNANKEFGQIEDKKEDQE